MWRVVVLASVAQRLTLRGDVGVKFMDLHVAPLLRSMSAQDFG
jgi:hypothetical protein